MGVKDLWSLLEPCGSRIEVETLSGRRLAVDTSIWLVQCLKAMRDKHTGEGLTNAHVRYFFNRVERLLYHRIRPVFVFDGGTPQLKRKTVVARRRRAVRVPPPRGRAGAHDRDRALASERLSLPCADVGARARVLSLLRARRMPWRAS